MSHQIWKVRHQAGEHPDYFSYSIRRDGFFPLLLTATQFDMLFPNIDAWSVPEAPKITNLSITGVLDL